MTIVYIAIGGAIVIDVALNLYTRHLLKSARREVVEARAIYASIDARIKSLTPRKPS